MRTLVVTGANEMFMPLLRGLIESLHQWEPRPFTDLACFDLGLAPDSRDWVVRHASHVVEPGWDLPVDDGLRREQPHLRALTVRPFLPRYFPGYDAYLWIDADVWVQERYALEWYFAVAAQGSLAVAPEVDRAYWQTRDFVDWRVKRLQMCFGQVAGERASWDTYFNAGVFALRSDAPHWVLWAKWFRAGLETTKGKLCCDQSALNHTVWTERLPVSPMPALCNWLCHLALPGFNPARGRFCEPAVPWHPIGILHLTAYTKDYRLDVPGGGTIGLRFPGRSIGEK